MSLALYVLYLWFTSNRIADIWILPKYGARIGAGQKCKLCGIVDP